ncbi:MAG TPA: nucleotide excision repair endonuclease [Candidatus Polarisedimenticolaceae bacterium]|nr:nucleotide excision repair endonuclease [Candidatus Polarisedimenticolaceae bacterium]
MERRPTSVVAERAVRHLRASGSATSSIVLARELLALTIGDEAQAALVLRGAFADDPRLTYGSGTWSLAESAVVEDAAPVPFRAGRDIAFVLVEGGRAAAHAPVRLTVVAAVRRRGEEIVAACGGELALWPPGGALKEELRGLLEGADVALHAPRGGLAAIEGWLGEPLDRPLSIPLLARRRREVPLDATIEALAAALGLAVTVADDAAGRVELVAACFDALRAPGEEWAALESACRAPVEALPWDRYAFTPGDLRAIPAVPGTYRFFDEEGTLLYVGKSRNLRRRLGDWFRDRGSRSDRVRALVFAVHRFELAPAGSGLAALIREAAAIRRESPAANVQREVHPRGARAARLESILILEPAEAPWSLRAWLIRDGRLVDTIAIGPKGGGLARIERVLEQRFFDGGPGPTSSRPKPVDVELIARWLAEHRDEVVAFDPTHLRTAGEVVTRLKWFLARGVLIDPEGSPILPR